MAKELSIANFDKEIAGDIPTLVDFWASWCAPCRMQSTILDKLEATLNNNARIYKVNVDSEEELARRYNIQSIPTLILFKNSEQLKRLSGVQSLESLSALLK